jgi:hypothetical protein
LTESSQRKLSEALAQITQTTRRQLDSIKLSQLVKPTVRQKTV